METSKSLLVIALTLAMAVTFFTARSVAVQQGHDHQTDNNPAAAVMHQPERRGVSRFLAERDRGNGLPDRDVKDSEPRSSKNDHSCDKNKKICRSGENLTSRRTTCCGNKCVNVNTDKQNCRECGKKCRYNEACCGGQCVNLDSDGKHCGGCNKKCSDGKKCMYGMCDYA